MVPLVASLILTGLELARDIERRQKASDTPPSPGMQRAAETLEEFRQLLASAVRENRDVSEDEVKFWHDRVNTNRTELQRRAKANKA
jgi:hypothetical protein